MLNDILRFSPLNALEIKNILAGRFDGEKIKRLQDLPPPDSLNNLSKIAKKIAKAIQEKKRIVVVGDYDVDGVVSCAILKEFFDKIPYVISIVIPSRFDDGYGLSSAMIDRLDCEMIITVDNGISAIEAAEVCKQRGIELIITDHHTPQENLPDALICNPKLSPHFPESEICGACVAWYLCAAIKQEMGIEVQMAEFLDLLALAIISDVMPLRGMNRVLLKKGLEVLAQSKRAALAILKEHFKRYPLNSQLLGYYFVPLLNCAGRMEEAKIAYEFLIEKDYYKALEIFKKLQKLNQKRKNLQNKTFLEAKEYFETQEKFEELPFVLVCNEQWNEGVVGIVAAKLCEEYAKPSIVLTHKEGHLKGSMRSLDIDCMKILEQCQGYLEAFGGHFGAAGLSLQKEKFLDFRDYLMQLKLPDKQKIIQSNILGALPLKEVNLEIFRILQEFEPYGEQNSIPQFVTQAKIRAVQIFGTNHSQMVLEQEGVIRKALVFFENLKAYENQEMGFAYSLQWDKFARDVVLKVENYTPLI